MSSPTNGDAPADPLRLRSRQRPGAIALEDGEREWTYEALDRGADELATHLSESGLGPGSIVGAWVDATPAGITSAHSVPRLGGILAPGHPRWNATDRANFLTRLRPAAVIAEPGSPPPAEGWTERHVELAALRGAGLSLFQPVTPMEPLRAPSKAHTLLWTSGSAGAPRVVCLSLASQVHSAGAANGRLAFRSDDAWLASLGLAHVGGLAIILRCALAGGRLVLAPPRFEPRHLLELLRSARVTHVSVVPAMLDHLLEADSDAPLPDRLRCVLVGGDATPAPLVSRAVQRGWPLALTYGLTEAASQVATAPPDLVRRKAGTAGAPLDGVEIQIATDGEIRVGGPTVMLGYLGHAGGLTGVRDGQVRTGDRGRLDEEGHLWVTGRVASRIVTGGSNVDPAEVEHILVTHPRVRAAGVVGIADEVWGERVVALIVARPPCAPEEFEADLAAWARRKLSGPRYPREWVFVRQLPLTTTGKPDRVALRNLATAALTSRRQT
jgi:O-succinylbenzoic acid--CoA ligase